MRFLFSDWQDWIGVLLNPTRETLSLLLTEAGKQAIAQLDTDITFDSETRPRDLLDRDERPQARHLDR